MKFAYRCGKDKCRKIYHLSKRIENYVKEKKCKCGGNLHIYKDRKRNKARTCYCDGLPHPHHKATSVWCKYHPIGPTDEDYGER